MILKTKRLVLRNFKKTDVKGIIRNINNLNVSKWLLAVPHPYTVKDAKWWINHCAEQRRQKPIESYELGIELKAKKGIVGGIGLSGIDRKNKVATIGYWLSEKQWRKGYVSEAAKPLLDLAFGKLHLKKVIIPIFATNKASRGFATHLGAKLHMIKKKSTRSKATGKLHDEAIYWLTKKAWKKRSSLP